MRIVVKGLFDVAYADYETQELAFREMRFPADSIERSLRPRSNDPSPFEVRSQVLPDKLDGEFGETAVMAEEALRQGAEVDDEADAERRQ